MSARGICPLRLAWLSLLALPGALTAADAGAPMLLTDFSAGSPDFGWYVLNDGVMGGQSEGSFESVEGELHFSGRTNTRGGGFSSIRTADLKLDLSGQTGIRLKVRGDGRRYTWRLATDAVWRGRPVSYWADFESPIGAWQNVDIPFTRFVPRFRGDRLDGPPLNTEAISAMGLMIYDRQDGPFDVYLASISAYRADSRPQD